MKLGRDFENRAALVDYLSAVFPKAAACSPEIPAIQGGREAAEKGLVAIDPERYRATRNQLDGAVTRLSPYLRHGVVSLAEVRRLALESGYVSEKLINELGWRDYFQRVYQRIGDDIWQDREDYKTGFQAADYNPELPTDLREGRTGLNCIDSFAHELKQTGYIHNHPRMWTAAYLVHFRRGQWQSGASWFLEHLLDGDPASNNLSWQWVASTFSSKPYIFDRTILEYNTAGYYCRTCPLANRGCPFDKPLPQLEQELFPNLPFTPAAFKPAPKTKRNRP